VSAHALVGGRNLTRCPFPPRRRSFAFGFADLGAGVVRSSTPQLVCGTQGGTRLRLPRVVAIAVGNYTHCYCTLLVCEVRNAPPPRRDRPSPFHHLARRVLCFSQDGAVWTIDFYDRRAEGAGLVRMSLGDEVTALVPADEEREGGDRGT